MLRYFLLLVIFISALPQVLISQEGKYVAYRVLDARGGRLMKIEVNVEKKGDLFQVTGNSYSLWGSEWEKEGKVTGTLFKSGKFKGVWDKDPIDGFITNGIIVVDYKLPYSGDKVKFKGKVIEEITDTDIVEEEKLNKETKGGKYVVYNDSKTAKIEFNIIKHGNKSKLDNGIYYILRKNLTWQERYDVYGTLDPENSKLKGYVEMEGAYPKIEGVVKDGSVKQIMITGEGEIVFNGKEE